MKPRYVHLPSGETKANPSVLCAAVVAAAGWALLTSAASAALTHRYSFNDGTAKDSVGTAHGVPIHAPLIAGGRVDFANGNFNVNPLTGQYIDLPNQIARTSAMTLETWVTFRGGGVFQEIATFGTSTAGEVQPDTPTDPNTLVRGTEYVALIANLPISGGVGVPAGTIRSERSSFIEQTTPLPTSLPLNVERHIAYAVDFPGRTSVLYVDGQEVARRAIGIDPGPQDQVNDWLGRSPWSTDPFFNGSINEFRIYDGALTSPEVAASFGRGPDVVPEPVGLGVVALGAAVLLADRARRRRRR